MFQASKKTQYGLRAMVCLSKGFSKRQVLPLREVSRAEGIPFRFLEKIMSALEKAGLIKAKKGAGGGYSLAKAPAKIRVLEIMEAIEGKIVPAGCAFCGKAGRCLSKSVWQKIQKSLNNTLKSITLADLIKK